MLPGHMRGAYGGAMDAALGAAGAFERAQGWWNEEDGRGMPIGEVVSLHERLGAAARDVAGLYPEGSIERGYREARAASWGREALLEFVARNPAIRGRRAFLHANGILTVGGDGEEE